MLSVTTQGLSKRFGDFHALRDCTLTVPAGEVFGLLGPNGAGKTTLIRLLMGYIRPTGGSASVGEIDVVRNSVEVRRRIAYLPGDARLPRHMKANALLEFFAGMHPSGDVQRSFAIADRLELDLRRRVAFMSTGMRQKLALAVVLAPHSPILILDEPTANLDPSVRGEVLAMVAEARAEGRTVIFSSHVLSEIEDVCDSAAFLRRGQLVLDQRIADLRDRHLVRGQCSPRLEQPNLAEVEFSVFEQDPAGNFLLDAAGPLAPLMRWLLTTEVENLRVEPVRLRTVYNTVHRGNEIVGEARSGDAPNGLGLEDMA